MKTINNSIKISQILVLMGLMLVFSCKKDSSSNSNTTPTPTPPTNHTVGEQYQGGIIIYVDGTGQHGVICSNTSMVYQEKWDSKGTTLIGANGPGIGEGRANTDKMYSIGTSAAANFCKSLDLNGYKDWYIPSQTELSLIYDNRLKIGGLTNLIYWSSTESSETKAWAFDFFTGFPTPSIKTNINVVRPVRVF